MKLNLAGVAMRGARAVIKVGRTARSGSPGRVDDTVSSMYGGEEGDASGGPGSSGNAGYSMTDITSLFGSSDFDNSKIYGGNEYDGDGFSTLAALLLERAGPKSVNGHSNSNQGNAQASQGHAESNQGNAQIEVRRGGGYTTGNDGPGSGTPNRVPEPNTVSLFGAGLFGLAMWMKRESGPRQL